MRARTGSDGSLVGPPCTSRRTHEPPSEGTNGTLLTSYPQAEHSAHVPPELPDQTTALPAERLVTDIEVSTLIAPRKPVGSSPDDDQTGVRALLSGLPEPDPMPAYVVERINASLAAEQAQRAVLASGASVTPLLATKRRRPGRLLFSIAGAAAAVVLIGVLGNNLLRDSSS